MEFQQKLVAVRRFMHYYNLPHILQRRVVQFYELQVSSNLFSKRSMSIPFQSYLPVSYLNFLILKLPHPSIKQDMELICLMEWNTSCLMRQTT